MRGKFAKKEGTKLPVPLTPSNLMIIDLNLGDKKRKAKLESKIKSPKSKDDKTENKIQEKIEKKVEDKTQ